MARAYRLVGPGAVGSQARVPFEVRDDAKDVAVALGPEAIDIASVARAIPEAATLEEGAMVVVLPFADAPSLASRVLAVLGRGRTVARAHRCSALLARGYIRIGASVDPETKLDLAYGFATGPCSEPG
jgi:hypothetical protein